MANGIKLSILIPTIAGREAPFNKLVKFLEAQLQSHRIWNEVEIVSESDDRTMSIGDKRQLLLERALGDFVVFIDDDDWVSDDYCFTIWQVISEHKEIDCIGFLQHCILNGSAPRVASISAKWGKWAENTGGFAYVRSPFFPTPIRRKIAIQIGYKDLRFGEDYDFSMRLLASGLITKEFFIQSVLYIYQYTYAPHAIKYGANKTTNFLNMTEQDYLKQNELGFEGDTYLKASFEEIVKRRGIRTIIETGTYRGSTTVELAKMTEHVYTVESNKQYYNVAMEKFAAKESEYNAVIYPAYGSSTSVLGIMIDMARKDVEDKDIMVFLDAHWGDNNPLLRELSIISQRKLKPVIAIHDFKVPGHPDLGFDTYNGQDYNWDWIKNAIEGVYGAGRFDYYFNSEATGAKRGVIFIEPK